MLVRVARRMWEAVGDDYVHDVTNVVANIDPHWCEKHPELEAAFEEGLGFDGSAVEGLTRVSEDDIQR